ncbi:hypothetical protein [Cysteiniphilum halobium]|uniref:hypothetical protein n=1 Tax=Cysteiniphilum halobium TaxID=2219059 RepID=UPI0013C32473|nr:hypothetical protein [Cysteiniphilum halobium]
MKKLLGIISVMSLILVGFGSVNARDSDFYYNQHYYAQQHSQPDCVNCDAK